MLRETGVRPAGSLSEVAAQVDMGLMERFCDELRWERERRKVSIEKISEETKVAVRHLHALEAGEYAELPGGVFRKGIVRSYLTAIGLDEACWIERFEASLQENGGAETADWAEFAENVRRNRVAGRSETNSRWIGVAMMVISLAAIAWGVWKFALHGRLIL